MKTKIKKHFSSKKKISKKNVSRKNSRKNKKTIMKGGGTEAIIYDGKNYNNFFGKRVFDEITGKISNKENQITEITLQNSEQINSPDKGQNIRDTVYTVYTQTNFLSELENSKTIKKFTINNIMNLDLTFIRKRVFDKYNGSLEEFVYTNNNIKDKDNKIVGSLTNQQNVNIINNFIKFSNITKVDISGNMLNSDSALAQVRHFSRILLHPRRGGAISFMEAENTKITHLNISNNNLSDTGAETIAEALEGNTTLVVLDISNNSVTDEGIKALAKALEGNSKLTTLNISNNNIGDDGAFLFSHLLNNKNCNITTLNISNNNIHDTGLMSIFDKLCNYEKESYIKLTTLDVSNNVFGIKAARVLKNLLENDTNQSTLLTLNISSSKINNMLALIFFEGLMTTEKLTTLDISNNEFGIEAAEDLADQLFWNSHLTKLDISKCCIDNKGIQNIVRILSNDLEHRYNFTNFKLKELYISEIYEIPEISEIREHHKNIIINNKTEISDIRKKITLNKETALKIGEMLKLNDNLEILDISNNDIGPEEASILANEWQKNENSAIKKFNISNNRIGDLGAYALAKAIPYLKNLTSLNISNNKIGDKGLRAISKALLLNKNITDVDMSGNSNAIFE